MDGKEGKGEILKPREREKSTGNTDLLLRLFDSAFFDEWMAISYLFKYSGTGVEDYICNRLYEFPESKIEKYLPQICIVLATKQSASLERYLTDMCSRSLRIAVKGYWLLTSFLDDFQKSEKQLVYIRKLCSACCDAALTGHWVLPFREHLVKTHKQARIATLAAAEICNAKKSEAAAASASAVDEEQRQSDSLSDDYVTEESPTNSNRQQRPVAVPPLQLPEIKVGSASTSASAAAIFSPLTSPRMRKNTFAATLDLFEALCEVSARLATIVEGDREAALTHMLDEINEALESPEAAGSACIFPMGHERCHERILRIVVPEAKMLNSREKVPFMLLMEVLEESGDPLATSQNNSGVSTPVQSPTAPENTAAREAGSVSPSSSLPVSVTSSESPDYHPPGPGTKKAVTDVVGAAMSALCRDGTPEKVASVQLRVVNEKVNVEDKSSWFGRQKSVDVETVKVKIHVLGKDLSVLSTNQRTHGSLMTRKSRRVPSHEALKLMAEKHGRKSVLVQNDLSTFDEGEDKIDPPSVAIKKAAGNYFDAKDMFGETFVRKKNKLKQSSLFGRQSGWNLRSVIIKAGDDCRQELMAVQLLNEFHNIFVQDGLRAWLRPIKVLVTSSHSGLIETVVDAHSIHSIKCKLPQYFSLADYFDAKHGKGSQAHYSAKCNFVESMAGYCIVCYLLQIKDRHNGNILLDEEGHVVHIDFGFMLSNSPGGINFETAPFKLTREFLEVMDSDADGKSSELFDYFKILCIQAFLACRKHSDRILSLIEMMQLNAFPCFTGGPRVLSALQKRFNPSATEEQCIDIVLNLISESMDAWRTRQYDYYQRVLNGIL